MRRGQSPWSKGGCQSVAGYKWDMRVLMGQFDPGMPHQGVIKLQTHRAPTCTTDTKSAVSDVQHQHGKLCDCIGYKHHTL